jgi:hypothetical protein
MIGLSALAVVPSTQARNAAYPRYFIDTHTLDRRLEAKGITYQSRHVSVDLAACLGLPRYGARSSGSKPTFWRFRCEINGTDSHLYDAEMSTTGGPQRGRWYSHLLSVKKLF